MRSSPPPPGAAAARGAAAIPQRRRRSRWPAPSSGAGSRYERKRSVANRRIEVLEENGVRSGGSGKVPDKQVERLVALGQALSDPIRVRMLGMMADGRSCCDFSGSGVPADEGDEGICVCEFEDHFGMA